MDAASKKQLEWVDEKLKHLIISKSYAKVTITLNQGIIVHFTEEESFKPPSFSKKN